MSDKNVPTQKKNKTQYRSFEHIVNTFYNEEIENMDNEEENTHQVGNIKIIPHIIYDKLTNDMKVEFKIGKTKMYRIKELSTFYDMMIKKQNYKYGAKLEFIHKKEEFEANSQELLEFILKYSEIIKYVNSNSNSNYRLYGNALNDNSIIIDNSGLDDLFEILQGRIVEFEKDYTQNLIEFVPRNPNIQFNLKKINQEEYKIIPNVDIFKMNILKGRNYNYILKQDKLYRCDENYTKTTIKLIEEFKKNYSKEVLLGKEELPALFSIIIPKVGKVLKYADIEDEIKEYIPKKLGVKVFLDFDKSNYLIAEVKFYYNNEEFNPLIEDIQINSRNIIEETKSLNMFRKTGFMLDNKNHRFVLPNNNDIYEFLSNDIDTYIQKFEIMVTDNFKSKQIRQNKGGNIGVKIENNLLLVDMTKFNIDKDEIKNIMDQYKLKKKFYRLKDGSFLNLEDNKNIEFMNKLITGMDVNYKELSDGEIRLPVYRTLYLNQILKDLNNTEISKNSDYKEIVSKTKKEDLLENIKAPNSMNQILRHYQKIGFQWLTVLDNYKFGGILADDMGLGKTIQILSMLINYIENTPKEKRKASIVICPSSLTLNWENEVKKFTDKIKTLVIRGSISERKDKINNVDKYDLVITSYDSLKRDIELYNKRNYEYRFSIADEAQYLKNSNTQNAKSIKQLKAETRFALTGTPIENSLSELWSIFDYIMPGYLFTYKKFKNFFEIPITRDNDQEAMKRLKMLIEPFILRRTKKEVLTELPEKSLTVLSNEMEEEQEKIYLSYLAQAKEEVANELQINDNGQSRIKILALLTRLRQICCHPSLFIEGYKGGSSKLEQCIEIIEDATNSGHKILLFSGYTSMFEIIEKRLKEKSIRYFKLTGATKVDERIEMVDEFNKNKDIKIFLISLKAGGTGLNLTGADMVIHYDPWWNASAENQATDRTHRIGQKNNVQVYKFITKNTIEEKIYELQQKKSELIDNVLDTKMSFINKLSKEELLELFK